MNSHIFPWSSLHFISLDQSTFHFIIINFVAYIIQLDLMVLEFYLIYSKSIMINYVISKLKYMYEFITSQMYVVNMLSCSKCFISSVYAHFFTQGWHILFHLFTRFLFKLPCYSLWIISVMHFYKYKNETNHPISSNSHPPRAQIKQYTASKWGGGYIINGNIM